MRRIGTNQIDLATAARHGVAAFNAPFSNTRSVVEIAIADIIALTRRLTVFNDEMHAGTWNKSAVGAHEIRYRTLGIVGYGNIGTPPVVLAENLQMSVVFYDTAEKLALARRCMESLDEPARDRGHRHAPRRRPRGQRRHVRCGAGRQDAAGAVFLNLSCGFVVDYGALRDAILSGHVAGAAVDAPTEPGRKGGPFAPRLQGFPNVIPHTSHRRFDRGGPRGDRQFVATKIRDYLTTGLDDAEREPAEPGARARRRRQPPRVPPPQRPRCARSLQPDPRDLRSPQHRGQPRRAAIWLRGDGRRGQHPAEVLDGLARADATIRLLQADHELMRDGA